MADADLFAFVLMPFEAQFDDLYRFGIKEPAAELGILAQRVDEQIFSEGILERIYRQILLADIIIAEMTGQNPNVFYEVGFAHGLDKLCILSTAVAEDIPFDLKHKRHIVHGNSIKTLRGRLTEELTWAKGEIENIQKSRLVVKLLKPTGDLEKTKHLAKGIIQFRIDMKNHSQRPSAEIEAVYFYSTKGWVLSQDGRNCPSTESDLPPFQRRHFLNSPVRRLQKGAWAQLKFEASKFLAFAASGEELKYEYRITGRSVLRLITAEGNFDYELSIDVSVAEIPF